MATRRRGGDASPTDWGAPPILILSHFCPKPFLCFGDVRPGASRTLPLAVLNPNAEAAAVTLPRGPAAERGLHVWPPAFELQVGVRPCCHGSPPSPRHAAGVEWGGVGPRDATAGAGVWRNKSGPFAPRETPGAPLGRGGGWAGAALQRACAEHPSERFNSRFRGTAVFSLFIPGHTDG